MPSTPPAETLAAWRHHLQDEADAAYLYSVIAEREPHPERRELFDRLAAVEQRHAAVWRSVLAEHGTEIAQLPPSRRARLLAWVARRLGSQPLVSLMLREEGQEVKSYLQLYHRSAAGTARDAALLLARESAEHARTLGSLAGAAGEPWHRMSSGGFLRNVVYGFNDGLTANFGLVAGVIGASVAPHIVLVSGAAGMIADALSMGASGYLAAKSEREVYAHEIAMEAEEIRIMPEVEEEELALLYEAKGMSRDHARTLARDVMQNPERALEEKARQELGIAAAHTTPLKEGWITGTATAIGAFIPVAPFLMLDGAAAVWTAFAVAMISHFLVGAARSVFTGRSVIRSGMDMFVVGLGVAAVGYAIGDLVARWLA
jgi:VIT1/CCC1 family predicted Fe2+/Mn2+ transporter/rubrerythrin